MPFNRPSLRSLIKRTVADVVASTDRKRAKLRYSPEGAIAKAVAGVSHGLHGHLEWVLEQMNPVTSELPYLRRWMLILAGLEPKDAVSSTGDLIITGDNGVFVPQGHTWLREGDSAEYEQEEDATIEEGQAVVVLKSVETGESYNIDGGEVMDSSVAIIGLDQTGTIGPNGLTGGAEAEDAAEALQRLLDHISAPRAGGTPNEYRDWALSVLGVDKAVVLPNYYDQGSVLIIIDTDSGTPSAALISDVENYINGPDVKPTVDTLYVVGAVHVPIPFSIQLEVDPDINSPSKLAVVREAVKDELRAMLKRDGGLGATIKLSRVSDAISNATGEHSHVLVQPTNDPSFEIGEVPDLGPVTWVE